MEWIRVVWTQLLDPLVEQSAQISYMISLSNFIFLCVSSFSLFSKFSELISFSHSVPLSHTLSISICFLFVCHSHRSFPLSFPFPIPLPPLLPPSNYAYASNCLSPSECPSGFFSLCISPFLIFHPSLPLYLSFSLPPSLSTSFLSFPSFSSFFCVL